jgi:hypothetical protein
MSAIAALAAAGAASTAGDISGIAKILGVAHRRRSAAKGIPA